MIKIGCCYFFLEAIRKTAQQAIETAMKINQLFDNEIAKIAILGQTLFSFERAHGSLKKKTRNRYETIEEILINMAEGMGFEPTIQFLVYTLSKRAPSTARPPLRYECLNNTLSSFK